jgi:molybdate-binding protein/CheY-like chemotaxis protein
MIGEPRPASSAKEAEGAYNKLQRFKLAGQCAEMRKLLYVEDNEDNIYMLQLRFDVLGGYEVLSARTGAAGIAMAASERPDLILMDLNLPGIDGWEAARRLKADPATRDIPIIALTSHAMAGDPEKALAAGCDDFDTKPVEFDRLLAKIDQVLARPSDRVSLEVVNLEAEARAPDLFIVGSHDIALDVVLGALAERGFKARTVSVGSLGGAAAVSRGQCDLAPVHLVDPSTGLYNRHLLAPGVTLVSGWRRMQGFVFRRDDARFAALGGAGVALKAALADPAVLMINRNAGSGTRVLIDGLLAGARPPGYANQPVSHNAVAAAIAQGRADWGVAIAPVAKMYGLALLPIAPEEYDFLLREERRERPAVQAFLKALAAPATRARIRALGMEPADEPEI